jgi:Skp family chaperone for outer membrane proteins
MSLLGVVVLVALAAPRAVGAQTGRIAVINTQQIIAESAAGRAAEQQFTAYDAERRLLLVDLQAQMTAKGQEIESLRNALSAEALAERERELQALDRQFTREQEDYSADMASEQQKLLTPVFALADEVLEAYTAEESFLMIWDVATLNQLQGALVHVAPTADVTLEIIRRMDELSAARSGGTLPVPEAAAPSDTPDPAATAPEPEQ